MKIHTTRGRLLASTVLCGAIALAASVAQAQTAPAAQGAAAASSVNEIVVTGTRIKGASNATSASPVSVATKAQIELTKADTIEDVLTHMTGPDFTQGTSAASNNGGGGVSNVGLRNLGPDRTLILMDGQRIIPTLGALVDLNVIPLSMVDRVEVLRDGASSIYGADAVGGVINIITKKNFNGMDANASYGESGHGDAQTYSLSSTVGVSGDKGDMILTVGWDHRDAIPQANRNWAESVGTATSSQSTYRTQTNILQEESNPANVWANGNAYDRTNPADFAALLAADPQLAYIPASGALKYNAGAPSIGNDLTSGLDRKQISFSTHYNLTDDFRFVSSGFFSDSYANQALRPEPLLGDQITTSPLGPFPGFFLPADQSPTGVSEPFYLTPNQFGPRTYREDSQTYRLKTGFEGTIFGKYDWEAGYVYQQNNTREDVYNEGNFEHLAILTEQLPCVDPTVCVANGAGAASAANPTSLNPAMIPHWTQGPNNIFTPAEVKYLTFDNTTLNNTQEDYAYADIRGPIWTLPAGDLQGVLGTEYRQERLQNVPNPLVQEGWAPNQSQITQGSYSVASIYGELSIPVLKDMPFVKNLTLDPSARYDHYTNFGGAFTNKVGVNYTVDNNVRFRFSYSTSFRAPNVNELFGGQLISDISASGDPCDTRAAGYNGNSNVGVGLLTAGSTCSAALKNVAGAETAGAVTNFHAVTDEITNNQMQILEGGNPQLKPEQSESYAIGVVVTPWFAPGLSIDVDYYDVRVKNAILDGGIAGTTSPDVVLDGCYGPAQNAGFCSLITRNGTGQIIQVNSLNQNFGTQMVRGIDYQIDYDTAAAHLTLPVPGSIHVGLQISNLMTNTTQTPGSNVSVQHAGSFDYSNEAFEPKLKGNAAVDYHLGPWTAHWDLQYYGHANLIGTLGGTNNEIGSIVYNNISGSYSFGDFGFAKKLRITLGIDNVADQDPPFLNGDSICKCNSLAGPFDVTGRFFYGRLAASF